MSKSSLSKGTLGLKFMNRTVPASPASSTPSTSNPPPAATASSAPTQSRAQATASEPISTRDSRPATTRIIHDSSLLSFPILSTHSTSFSNSNAYYNSMPLTSTAISGRRSFGGANIEIERLNDPSSHQAPSKTDQKDGKESKKSKKQRRMDEPVSTRRTDLSTASKRSSKIDAAADATVKKRRVSSPPPSARDVAEPKNTFKKPSGFEGAKMQQSRDERGKGKGKGKSAGGSSSLMDLDQHEWIQRGQTREWDLDKDELGSEEDDQRILDVLDRDEDDEDDDDDDDDESASDDSEDDDEEEIRKMLVSAKALDQKRAATGARQPIQYQKKKEAIDREVRKQEDDRMMGESKGSVKRKQKARK